MKKNDMILTAVLLAAALAALAGFYLYAGAHTKDAEAVVTIDGEEYGRYPLSEEKEVRIEQENGSYNVLVIKDGKADMTEASCPDKICVRHKKIDRSGETLVCLPNQAVVEIQNAPETQLDAETH